MPAGAGINYFSIARASLNLYVKVLSKLVGMRSEHEDLRRLWRCKFLDHDCLFVWRQISIEETNVKEIEHNGGHVRNVVFNDGSKRSFDAVYFRPPFRQHCDIPEALGCELNEQGYLKVDQTQKTTVEGVFACGDNSSMMRSVANAVAAGNFAGAVINRELATERF